MPTKQGKVFYMRRNHVATARRSNLTQLPTRNEGILPAAACLKIVTSETQRNPASSLAVIARPIFSILSAKDTTNHHVILPCQHSPLSFNASAQKQLAIVFSSQCC